MKTALKNKQNNKSYQRFKLFKRQQLRTIDKVNVHRKKYMIRKINLKSFLNYFCQTFNILTSIGLGTYQPPTEWNHLSCPTKGS